ncbi:helix-turn-helix domain-containing protein [Butyrivibrio fibrisolvens]|uniref:helix-turn-helix domain-containing protein n=1 Tax=Butyrivibrio fibrisolvens TaxID=831 RepID=UPI0003B79D71|nr:helix-turn-helix transcriptional regulator [Butyrivibrio fibrisolvens]
MNRNKNHELADVIRLARGDRSLRDYAEVAGVSYMTIYKAEQGDYVPSPKIIKKLTSSSADPQNGVTYEDMMITAEYQDSETLTQKASILAEKMVEESSSRHSDIINVSKNYKGLKDVESTRRMELLDQERRITGILLTAMMSQNIRFNNNVDLDGYSGSKAPNVILNIEKSKIKQWWFDIRCVTGSSSFRPLDIQLTLANILEYKTSKEIKGSIVVNDRYAYDYLAGRAYKIAYRGELSVILVDYDCQKVIDECYLANYNEGDHGAEVYLR